MPRSPTLSSAQFLFCHSLLIIEDIRGCLTLFVVYFFSGLQYILITETIKKNWQKAFCYETLFGRSYSCQFSRFFFFFFSVLCFLSHKFNNIGHIAILENIQQRIRGMQGKQIVAHCLLRYSLLFFVSPSDLTVWKERLPREGHAKATRKPRDHRANAARAPRMHAYVLCPVLSRNYLNQIKDGGWTWRFLWHLFSSHLIIIIMENEVSSEEGSIKSSKGLRLFSKSWKLKGTRPR